jgi:hypothetical protein
VATRFGAGQREPASNDFRLFLVTLGRNQRVYGLPDYFVGSVAKDDWSHLHDMLQLCIIFYCASWPSSSTTVLLAGVATG